jgi:hypothetical protein
MQNLKTDAAIIVLFSFKLASIFIDLFIRFRRPAESIPQIENTLSTYACDAGHAIGACRNPVRKSGNAGCWTSGSHPDPADFCPPEPNV